MAKELWKPVKGYEGSYEVSSKGRVRSVPREIKRRSKWGGMASFSDNGRVLKSFDRGRGYYAVNLCLDGEQKTESVHQLVAKAFIVNPEGFRHINHIDCNPANNQVENLEWCTPRMNTQHSVKLGRMFRPFGEKNNRCKLRRKDVVKIKLALSCGLRSVDLADIFRVTPNTLQKAAYLAELKRIEFGDKRGLPEIAPDQYQSSRFIY